MERCSDTFDIMHELRIPGKIASRYYKLLDCLNQIEFEWSIPMDRNRAKDGLTLRRNLGYPDTHVASVLEVLSALAIRLDDEYIGDPAHPRPDIIFWDMIKNLELDWCTDTQFDEEQTMEVVKRWMDRRFLPDGTWSIFRLHYPMEDQREIEIWSQAMAYITERYYKR